MIKRTYRVARPAKRRKKKEKTPEAKAREKLWELCKQIVRLKYGNTCYTCGAKNLEGSNWHTGHFIPSATCGAFLRYNIDNLRPQCFRCNMRLSGNVVEYYRAMVRDNGQEFVDQLFRDKNRNTRAHLPWLNEMVDNHTKVLEELIKLNKQ
jgi:hypothetical protein